jgi:hypothetical protein
MLVIIYKVTWGQRLPLWSSGQDSWLQRSRVRLPVLADFLRSSGSGRGSTQPREELHGRNNRGFSLQI